MARVEDTHWWYRGLRDLLVRCLGHGPLALPPHPRIVDAGCGTGANLAELQRRFAPAYLGGFDLSEEALELARGKAPGADLWRDDVREPRLRERNLDLVLSCDVLYITGLEQTRPGLERLVAALRPGGLVALDLPAYDWLYSEHDVAVGTSERVTARQVHAFLESSGLRVELLTYRLCLLFPLVVLVRLPRLGRARQLARARRPGAAPRSDLHAQPGRRTQQALTAMLRAENAAIARGVTLPWGSSVFAIGRRP